MKKIFKVFLIVGFLFNFVDVTPVYANWGDERKPIVLDIDSTEDFTKANEEIIKRGREKLITILAPIPGETLLEGISLSMSKYFQSGQSWSGDYMQYCGVKIGTDGCALTSFSMVVNYYGFSHNPGVVNSNLGSYACPFDWQGAVGSNTPYSPLYLAGSVHNSVSDSYAKDYILGSLRDNRPVIVGMYKGTTPHFEVARAYEHWDNGEKNYFIYDPSSSNYNLLLHYIDNGWTINRLKVYDN